jgi:hypothetical protein
MLAVTHHLIVQLAYLQSHDIPISSFLNERGYMGIHIG